VISIPSKHDANAGLWKAKRVILPIPDSRYFAVTNHYWCWWGLHTWNIKHTINQV